MNKLYYLILSGVLFSTASFLGCQKEDVTQVEYVVPVWKGSLESAPSDPQIGWAYYNTALGQSFIYDGQNWQIMAQNGLNGKDGKDGLNGQDGKDGKDGLNGLDGKDGKDGKDGLNGQDGKNGEDGKDGLSSSDGLIFCGETTETIDGVEYVVKSYAQVLGDPHFYSYFKYYYLDDKLRRTKLFDNEDLDNIGIAYTDFDESKYPDYYTEKAYFPSGKLQLYREYNAEKNSYTEYYENGKEKVEAVWNNDGSETYRQEYTYYENGNKKTSINYHEGEIYSSFEYYENGKTKSKVEYNKEGKLTKSEYTYYENDEIKSAVVYNETSKNEYTYYENGSKKSCITYTNGKIDLEEYYYPNNEKMLSVDYYSDGTLHSFLYYYESGNTKYLYSSEYLKTYEDNEKDNSTNYEDMTVQQALEFLETLRP